LIGLSSTSKALGPNTFGVEGRESSISCGKSVKGELES
jgi:hypothetical protein